jgi:hypothetical protein
MAGAKEIRTKIASVKSTQKITNAMEMVAASKMRKAQERMARGKPYAERSVRWSGISRTQRPSTSTCTCSEREVKRVGFHRRVDRPRIVRRTEHQPVQGNPARHEGAGTARASRSICA